jgi:hypothetical protein
MDANRRALDKAVKSLREVQAAEREAAAAPQPAPATETIQAASPEIGSVPDIPAATPQSPAPSPLMTPTAGPEPRNERPTPSTLR